jgi:predicted HTH transcriptional regulator
MVKNPTVSMTQIAYQLGISKRKTLDNITKLKVLGFVNRVGSPKGGSWIVKENR